MEQSITFRIEKKHFIKSLFVFFFTPKILSALFGLTLLTVLPQTLNPFSAVRLITTVLTAVVFMIIPVIMLSVIIPITAAFIFKQEKQYADNIEVRFYDTFLEEITANTKLTLQYEEIHKLKLHKTVLLIYINSLRAIIIPASTEYDIKKIYAKLYTKNMN